MNRISFLTALTLVFITLKLTNFINCSWWFILSPLYAGVLIIFIIVSITVLIKKFN